MIGAIAGDVLGSVYEAQTTKQKDFRLFHWLGRPTDDSVLTMAVAATLLDAAAPTASGAPAATVEDYAACFREFGRRYPNAGYGGSFRRWFQSDADSPGGAPYNSWGNGSAMRVSPIGWAFDNEPAVLDAAELSALPTHNHPEGVKGAGAVALAVFLARTGATKEEIRVAISTRFGYDLNRTIDSIRTAYEFDVSCQGSVPEAIIAVLDSTDFEDAIRNAVSLGGDADTQACIAGAIAEAFYGGVPARVLAWVFPRLDNFQLDIVARFLHRFVGGASAAAADNELDARREASASDTKPTPRMDGRTPGGAPMVPLASPYTLLLHRAAWQRLGDYAARLSPDRSKAGARLRATLSEVPVPRIDSAGMLDALLATKRPRVFAESEVKGDGSDWTGEELRLLGDVSVAVRVTVYDDGRHAAPLVHDRPFTATLLFVPGALLRSGSGSTAAADWADVVRGGRVVQERYEALYERRLLPALRYASATAEAAGRRALVTIPGVGCGQFAGPFHGKLGPRLQHAIASIFRRHAESLTGIRAVWFDPYSECDNEDVQIGDLTLYVRPLTRNKPGLPQLSRPDAFARAAGDPALAESDLYSVVAWDHVSWPGNDFFVGARSTDDGVKAAATDSMFALTGFRGQYNTSTNTYDPPTDVRTWEELVLRNDLRLRATGNVVVVGAGTGEVEELDESG
ncbi:MAG: hypothetical protein EA382_18985 [Spirochaetaceae bacterium]|nr:MAG: hypothetical protein EA382_18985 [Spirochaetaceae bacterium]